MVPDLGSLGSMLDANSGSAGPSAGGAPPVARQEGVQVKGGRRTAVYLFAHLAWWPRWAPMAHIPRLDAGRMQVTFVHALSLSLSLFLHLSIKLSIAPPLCLSPSFSQLLRLVGYRETNAA